MPDARQIHSDDSYASNGRHVAVMPRTKTAALVSNKEDLVSFVDSTIALSDEKSKKINKAVAYLHSIMQADIMAERASAVSESAD